LIQITNLPVYHSRSPLPENGRRVAP
jgi:hypothetical protein